DRAEFQRRCRTSALSLQRTGAPAMVRPLPHLPTVMREPTSIYASRRRTIRVWLLAVAALIFAMVLVGGATRLTESALSITGSQPVAGAIPPLSDAAWQAEFDKYKTIPQYQQMNRGMSLAEFKTIFWWEWAHRLLGRLIGAAFLLPFLWFL